MNDQKLWLFSALDSWFFRDGTPFTAGDGGQRGAASVFPPFMTTLQGAIRTLLAQGQGWRPDVPERWPDELGTPDDLGKLRLDGPYLRWGHQWYFPAPLHLVRGRDRNRGEEAMTFLRPGAQKIDSDLGSVRLPELEHSLEGAKPLERVWISKNGLQEALAGTLPRSDELCNSEVFWRDDPRLGIERDPTSRTTKEGRLYSSVHTRPREGLKIGVLVGGIAEDWHPRRPMVVPLGGEGRMARVEVLPAEEVIPPAPRLDHDQHTVRFTVTLATPGRYGNLESVVRFGPPDLPGTCVAACLGKVQMMGGWDLVRHRSRPLEPVLPAGSTWFLEADNLPLEEITKWHGRVTGERSNYGFGKILIGKWGGGEQ